MKPIVVIVGMARSGTSLIAQALERLGVSFGSPLVEADHSNVRGYYEHKELVKHQVLLMHTCYDRRGWSDIGELIELDGKVEESEEQMYALEEVLLRETEHNDLFGLKLPWLPRIPYTWGAIFDECNVKPVYIHAMRDPALMFTSILKANDTADKATPELYRQFLREWAWTNTFLLDYEPRATIWHAEWFGPTEGTMKKLADAIGKETVSTKGLLL